MAMMNDVCARVLHSKKVTKTRQLLHDENALNTYSNASVYIKLYGRFEYNDVFVSLFSRTQKVNDPCGQHIYIQEQCSTFDIDKDK